MPDSESVYPYCTADTNDVMDRGTRVVQAGLSTVTTVGI